MSSFTSANSLPPVSTAPHRSWNLPGAQVAYDGGLRALRAGFHGPARSIFGVLALHEPGHPEVRVALARTELAAGDPAAAERILDSLEADLRYAPTAQVLRAECALRRGDLSRGLSLSFACSEAFPRDAHGRYLAARLLWLGGQEGPAEIQFLSLAGDPEVGSRSCAWSVFCGWRQGTPEKVSALLANLRRDDVVAEGLREFGHHALGIAWAPGDRVEASVRQACADAWSDLFHRQFAAIRARPGFARGRLLL